MEVFKICAAEGVQAFNLGVPILAEEMGRSFGPRIGREGDKYYDNTASGDEQQK